MKRLLFLFAIIFIAATGWRVKTMQGSPSGKPVTSIKASGQSTNDLDKTQYSIDDKASLWWIVNKDRPLPAGYTPNDLTTPSVPLRLSPNTEQMKLSSKVVPDLQRMFDAARSAGHALTFASGYRSEAYQKQLYDSYVARDGQADADKYSARPGTSEHQTGYALDICLAKSSCELEESFGGTPAGKWLADNAHNYGFVVRYLKNKDAITGYQYEPWHFRYVGKSLATELYDTGKTMEEYFGLVN